LPLSQKTVKCGEFCHNDWDYGNTKMALTCYDPDKRTDNTQREPFRVCKKGEIRVFARIYTLKIIIGSCPDVPEFWMIFQTGVFLPAGLSGKIHS
jgi:hypothetical protein